MIVERWLFDRDPYCSQETGISEGGAIGGGLGAGPVTGAGGTAVISPTIVIPAPPPPPSAAAFQQAAQRQSALDVAAFTTQRQTADIAAFAAGPRGFAVIGASDVPALVPARPALAPALPAAVTIRSPEEQFAMRLGARAGGALGEAAGTAIGVVAGQAVPLIGEIPGAIIGGELGRRLGMRAGERTVSSIEDFVRSFSRPITRQPTTTPQAIQPFSRQPSTEPAPLIIPSQEGCATCGQDLSRLETQRGDVQRAIQVEESQQREQRIEQQQRAIEQQQQQEQRPLASRDLDTEIMQKRQLQRQIEDEIQAIQQGRDLTSTTTAPLIAQPTAQLFTQRPAPETLPPPAQAVRFCVYCSSQKESLKFLNGEPSECSVEP